MKHQETIQDIRQSVIEQCPEMVSSLLLDGLAGTVIPGVSSMVLAYRQKRQERLYIQFMKEIKERSDELEDRLKKMYSGSFLEFKDKYFGLVSDYVLEEVQEQKIHYLANGLINLAAMRDANEDFILTYYDTLRDLRMLDTILLRRKYDALYLSAEIMGYDEFISSVRIDDDQYRAIMEKLERMGLLVTTREVHEDNLYRNVQNIQDYLKALDRYIMQMENGKRATKKAVPSFKRLEKSDSYRISRFGREFVEFFMDVEKPGN